MVSTGIAVGFVIGALFGWFMYSAINWYVEQQNAEYVVMGFLKSTSPQKWAACHLLHVLYGRGIKVKGPNFYILMNRLEQEGRVCAGDFPLSIGGIDLQERRYWYNESAVGTQDPHPDESKVQAHRN